VQRNDKNSGTTIAILFFEFPHNHLIYQARPDMKFLTLIVLVFSLNISHADDAQRLPNKPNQKYLKTETKKAARATRTNKVEGIESKSTNNIGTDHSDDNEPSMSSTGIPNETARATGVAAKKNSARTMTKPEAQSQVTDCSNLANKAQENCYKANKVKR
jgi:hypothetical protein